MYTITTYTQLNALLKIYGNKKRCSLKVASFPCNQFGHQEPPKDEELLNTLQYVRPGNGYVPDKNMDMYSKVMVNGEEEIPLFSWLKKLCPRPTDIISNKTVVLWKPIKTTDIEWNFEKFLIDHEGNPVRRFSERSPPFGWKEHIKELIDDCDESSQEKYKEEFSDENDYN